MTAEDADTVFLGGAPNDLLGEVMALAGDLDGDGQPELAFGAPAHSPESALLDRAGLVYIAQASATGTIDLATEAHAWMHGEASDDEMGTSITSIGDTNGDGYGDLLIGSPFHDSAGTNAGAVYLMFGGSL